MASRSLFKVDGKRTIGEIRITQSRMRQLGEEGKRAMGRALEQYAELIVAKAQENVPAGKGRLRESGVVTDAFEGPNGLTVQAGFNVVYAAIRDQGGTIRPVRAKALFIPLKPNVRPGQPGLKILHRGEPNADFVLVPGPTSKKKFVTQKGNHYFTNAVQALAPRADELIGKAFEKALEDKNA